jgi:gas vesicle structural protein
MASPDSSSLAEVLDRILDKGVVVDVWARDPDN